MSPRLSILIPAIPSRFEKATALYKHIMEMVGDKDIEVIMLMDNKKRSIGEKREALKNLSNGKYFMFCDDDDSLLSLGEVYAAAEKEVDVISFQSRCKNSSGKEFVVTMNLGNEVEHKNDGEGNYVDLNRPPFTQCAWHSKFKVIEFPPINYGEDWAWIEKAIAVAQSEIHIPNIIHSYNFDPLVTEASTETNSHWTNPNVPVKRAIVNLVTHNRAYMLGQERLFDSLRDKFDGEVYLYVGEESVGAPSHKENPYAFKVYAIERMKELGFNQVLWLDASIYAVKPVQPVFDWLTEKGVFLEEAGHWAGSWSPDYVLNYFGLTKDEAMRMPMFAAGYCGFDFRRPESIELFAEWKESMLNGMFKGGWDISRHDMTCGSIIANKRGLLSRYSPGGQFFAYVGEVYGEPKESVVFHLKGVA